jgi:hypothetical protein
MGGRESWVATDGDCDICPGFLFVFFSFQFRCFPGCVDVAGTSTIACYSITDNT